MFPRYKSVSQRIKMECTVKKKFIDYTLFYLSVWKRRKNQMCMLFFRKCLQLLVFKLCFTVESAHCNNVLCSHSALTDKYCRRVQDKLKSGRRCRKHDIRRLFREGCANEYTSAASWQGIFKRYFIGNENEFIIHDILCETLINSKENWTVWITNCFLWALREGKVFLFNYDQ